MFSKRRKFALFFAIAGLGVIPLVNASYIDFSENLLSYVSRRFSAEAPRRLLVWQRLIFDMRAGEAIGAKRGDPRAESLTLRKVNEFFNQIPYFNDSVHWGKNDYWATPVESLSSFGADCEDYSIAKYMSLKELGLPIEKIRMTYVRAKEIGESHMVLAYYPSPESEPYILDNLTKEVKLASQRQDLEPVFSFNDDDLWLASGQTSKGGATQVRLWRDLIERINREQKM